MRRFDILEDQNKIVFGKGNGLAIGDLWNLSTTWTKQDIGFVGFKNDIEFDWIGKNVYFVGNALIKSAIFVMSKFNGDVYVDRELIGFLHIVTKAIALDPAKG